jgi:hypothetical protein
MACSTIGLGRHPFTVKSGVRFSGRLPLKNSMKATWYIRENPAGARNGTSYSNAFDVKDINWSVIKEGDTLIVELTHRIGRVPPPIFCLPPTA